jgi:small-conductance mechanosensitive channel
VGLLAGLALPTAALPAAGEAPAAEVRLGSDRVLPLKAGRAGATAAERAVSASRALARASAESGDATAQVEVRGDVAAIRVGRVTVVELGPEDVAATGAVSLEALAQTAASRVDRALASERRRARISAWVFDVSLVVFSGLVAFLLARKLAEIDRRLGGWARRRPDRVPALRLGGLEIVSSAGMAGALVVLLRLGRWLSHLVLAYAWVVFALSVFPASRDAGSRLGQVVLAPAAAILGRIGSALPVLLGAGVAGILLWLLLRAVLLFFGSVARGETHLAWLPTDLARPVGALVALAVAVAAAVFAAPLLTGSDRGVLSQVGSAALAAVALAAAPLLANVAAGLPRVFRRTFRPGAEARIGETSGVVRDVSLLHVELEDGAGGRVLVPHLVGLIRPTRLSGPGGGVAMLVAVDPSEDQARVREAILGAGGPGAGARMVRLDADAAVYVVTGPDAERELAGRVAEALRAAGVRLGRAATPPAEGA